MIKKYQIFISSTYKDLIDERKIVQDTILSMCQLPIGMEMFSAADEEQWEIIKETIDSSDYYVLIIAHRYGTVIEEGVDKGISYTEKEYRYARNLGIPILAFIIDKDVLVLPDNVETDVEKKERLLSFIEDMKKGRIVEWWKSKEDLAKKIMNSLNKQIIRGKRPGWIRADKFSIEDTQKELIELNKKIRILEKENSELRDRIIVRIPNLYVSIDNTTNLSVPYHEEDLQRVIESYNPLTIDDIPAEMQNGITEEKINEYNNSLPNQDQIEDFIDKLQFYYRATEHSQNIKIAINNDGTLKAKDIHIEILFPDEIKVYSKHSIENLKMPERPKTAINPLKQMYSTRSYYDAIFPNVAIPKAPPLIDMDFISQINSTNKHFYNDDNSISIRMEDLLNGYEWIIDDKYCIVPSRKGVFQIHCDIMCEEYVEAQTLTILCVVE
jgi:hypothetical protein